MIEILRKDKRGGRKSSHEIYQTEQFTELCKVNAYLQAKRDD